MGLRPATPKDLELGNWAFGNSRGNYCIEPRMEWQEVFCKFLYENGFDSRGYVNDNNPFMEGYVSYENDTFLIRPYIWDDENPEAELPNFVYKPENIEICWYKYPFRNSFINVDITLEKLKEILEACAKSMKEVTSDGQ